MGDRLQGKVALVTGAGMGIGRATALRFAAEGANVVVSDINDEAARKVATEIGETSIVNHCDTSVEAEVAAAIEATIKAFGAIDILVNNAGVGPENPAEAVRESDFDLTLAVNLKGTFFASQAAGRVMIGQGGGRIINLSSQAAFVALPGESVYCMTKAAISHLTRCLAVEWGRHNVTVNAVAPTFIATPGTEAALSDPRFRADVTERIAGLHRIGRPMDVAGAVVFLASPAASLITGDTVLVDGGWTAR